MNRNKQHSQLYEKSRFKAVIITGLLILLFIISWLVIQISGFFLPNYGWEVGYYAQFNRVKNVIEHMKGITIIDHWQHKDVTLEDFGFTLLVDDFTNKIEVTFEENSPQMKLRKKQKIREFVQKEIDSNILINSDY